MSGDYSRQRFDPRKHYSAVLMQQGRVQLDADWNEMAELFDRRFRAERVDTLGRFVVPRETPGAFRVYLQDGALRVGRGRCYVDGLLAENHGAGPLEYDRVLDELRGSQDVAYAAQPYFPTAAAHPPPVDAPYLVYLDAWQRERTYLEDPGLIEPALGVDTTARMQTVWQVRLLPGVAADVTAATPDDDAARLPGWAARIAPSAIRLTTATGAAVAPDVDPCLIPPSGGFRGLENRLYRVEIHDPGAPGEGATFKWSRDNAAVATNVTAVSVDRRELTVVRTGRDALLRFNPGDWVEITDDRRESDARPGQMALVEQVDDDARTLRLRAALADDFTLAPAHHTRVRRWDQAGEVIDDKGKTVVKLTDASAGVIPVPTSGSVVLESGIKITFSGGEARAGDHWTFAARSDSAAIDILTDAPPRGPGHHYARLGVVDPATGTASDLRVQWPPTSAGGGDCTISVSAEDHASGRLTIQKALDDIKATGGSVCLGPGLFRITTDALRVAAARRITLHGRGAETVLVRQTHGPFPPNAPPDPTVEFDRMAPEADNSARSLLRVEDVVDFTLRDLVLVGSAAAACGAPLVRVHQCAGLRVERCFFVSTGRGGAPAPALELGRAIVGATLRDNVFLAKIGVRAGKRLFTADLRVEDNVFACRHVGLDLGAMDGLVVHTQLTRLAGNDFSGCLQYALGVGGVVHQGMAVTITGNSFDVLGTAIASNATRATITGNSMRGGHDRKPLPVASREDADPPFAGAGRTAISVGNNLHTPISGDCVIADNDIRGFFEGIVVRAALRRAVVRDNTLDQLVDVGIHVEADARTALLHDAEVTGNRVSDVLDATLTNASARGIFVFHWRTAVVADNTVRRVGAYFNDFPPKAIIQGLCAFSCVHVTVRGNRLHDIGPLTGSFNVPHTVGIIVGGSGRVSVCDNLTNNVNRSTGQVSFEPLTVDCYHSGNRVWRDAVTAFYAIGSHIVRTDVPGRAVVVQNNQLEAEFVPNHIRNNFFAAISMATIGGDAVVLANHISFRLGIKPTFPVEVARIDLRFPGGGNGSMLLQSNMFVRVDTFPDLTPLAMFGDGGTIPFSSNFLRRCTPKLNDLNIAPGNLNNVA